MSIAAPYLLAINIPAYRDPAGGFHVDALWRKDLDLHREYLDNIELACPVVEVGSAPAGTLPLAVVDAGAGMRIVALPAPGGWLGALLALPKTVATLAAAVRRARIVHTCVAGWPYPLGWLTIPLKRGFGGGRRALVVVESAPWRCTPGAGGLVARLRAALFETMARHCLRHAEWRVFTQPQYRDSLLDDAAARSQSLVVNASWIDDETLLDADAAQRAWAAKRAASGFKCLFVGRLVEDKGILVALDAVAGLAADTGVTLDVLGDGPLAAACRQRFADDGRIRFLGSLPYGPEYFARLDGYHALLVPSLSDEQPRVVYDAYARGVTVLASDTPGHRACVEDGASGRLYAAGSAAALAACLNACRADVATCERLALNGLARARQLTHRQMHAARRRYLEAALSGAATETGDGA